MWTRSELKAKAKAAFKTNYWKSVLVAALLSVLVGTSGAAIGGRATFGGASGSLDSDGTMVEEQVLTTDDDLAEFADDGIVSDLDEPGPESLMQDVAALQDELGNGILVVGAAVVVLFLVVFAVILVIEALLVNPLEVGGRRFFLFNLNRSAQIAELAHAYDHGYRNTVKTMFLRDIKVIGWALLLVVPGIVKSYEYRMIPYLLAEDPQMTPAEAFSRSRELMDGNKWRAFVLDLSFIGWDLLGLLTLGIVTFLYVDPYRAQTHAALYEALRYGNGMPDFAQLPEA